MDVSIIFVNYKTKDLTINAIKSVIEKTQEIKFEIFVIDNNSQDGSIEAIEKEFPNVNIIKNPVNAGFGAANNLAIKQANGKYILCLNTDTLLINNAIKIMYDFMNKEENKNVAVCGSSLYDENLNYVMSFANFPNFFNTLSISWLFKKLFPILRNQKEPNDIKEVDFITGADIFFRKSILDKIGLFDENFFMYAEEVDLCKRIKKEGYSIKIIPHAKIIHLEEKSSKNFWKNAQMRVKSKYIYARKHQSLFELYSMKISYIIMHAIGYLFGFNKEHIELIKLHLEG